MNSSTMAGRPTVQTNWELLEKSTNLFKNLPRMLFFEKVTDYYNEHRENYHKLSPWMVRTRLNQVKPHTKQRVTLSSKPGWTNDVVLKKRVKPADNQVIKLTGSMTVVINLNLGTVTVTR